MMSVSEGIHQEFLLLLMAMAAGSALVMVYDVLRIFRCMIPHPLAVTALEDVLYWIGCAAAVLILLYQYNNGSVRGFVIGGILLGMIVWNQYVSPLTVGVLGRILHRIYKTVTRPIKFFFKVLLKPVRFVSKYIKRFFCNVMVRVKRGVRALKLALCKL